MENNNKIVVVMIVSLTIGALVDTRKALLMDAGAVLVWILQNQVSTMQAIRRFISSLKPRGLLRVPTGTEIHQYRSRAKVS